MADWVDTYAVTRRLTKMHRLRWKIENFSKVALVDKMINGPYLCLTPTLLLSTAFQRISGNIRLYVYNESDAEIQIERKLRLSDCFDEILHEEDDSRIFRLRKDDNVDLLGNVPEISRFDTLPNSTLIIDLSISIETEVTTEIWCPEHVSDTKEKLIADLKLMMDKSVKSDVSLLVGDERIPAHWSILCSRSPYFKNMFDSEMLERVQNTITITDLSFGAIKKFIEFLYTADFIEGDLDELFELYYAADKYEVMDLRTLCGHKIMSKATIDNVCQIIQLGHRHNDKYLKILAMNFIHLHSDSVLETDGWKKFESSDPLAADMFSFCVKKKQFHN